MWNVSTAYALFAIITLIIGVIIMLSVVFADPNQTDLDNQHRLNTTRATLFLLLTIILVLIMIFFQYREYNCIRWW